MKDWEYYRRLITSEYRGSTRYNSVLAALLKSGLDSDEVAENVIRSFDLDSAVGRQLDAIGAIVGVQRRLNFQPARASADMDDDTYRVAIRCKIVQNHWDGSIKSLYREWAAFLPDVGMLYVKDNQDMTFDISMETEMSLLEKEMVCQGYIVPKPEGVRINRMEVIAHPTFGEFYRVIAPLIHRAFTVRPEVRVTDFTAEKPIYLAGVTRHMQAIEPGVISTGKTRFVAVATIIHRVVEGGIS